MRHPISLLAALLAGGVARLHGAEPADFEGTWLGTVIAPNATAEIGFAFKRTEKGLLTTFHMPAMFVHGAPLGPAELKDETLLVRPLDTRLRHDGERLVGTFGLAHLPVELRRGGEFSPAPPPPTYPPAPAARWSISLGAETWASPVVHAGVIYLGTADGTLHALEAPSGRSVWQWRGEHPVYGTALVTAKHVYVVDQQVGLIALRCENGRLAWRRRLHDEKIAGKPAPQNPTFNRRTPVPVLAGDTLFAGSTDGGVYAIDAMSGAVRWRHDAGTPLFAAPAVDGRLLWFGGYDGSIFALDRETRREIARTKLPGPVVSTPVIADETIVVGCRDYTLYGLKRAPLEVAWKFSFWFSWIESTPALVDGRIYVGGSDFARVTALDPATGRAEWSTIVHGLAWGTPLVTDDTVFAGASAQRGAILPHAGGLVALDRNTGAVKWRHVTPPAGGAERAGYLGSLALAGDLIIAAGFDGTVSAFPGR